MKTTTEKLLERIEKQEKSIKIIEMKPFDELKVMLEHRIDLRNTCTTLRAVLRG